VVPGSAEVDQVQGTADMLQPLLSDVQVSGGAGQLAVTEQALESQWVDASLQQMSGKAVSVMPSSA
jgi:hypothetical protein